MKTTTLTIYSDLRPDAVGIRLHGHCDDMAGATQLERAVIEAIGHGQGCVWIDCRQLERLSWHGQRAVLNANQRAWGAGVTLQWCGLTEQVREMLQESGLSLLLHMLPPGCYPFALVPQRVASLAQ